MISLIKFSFSLQNVCNLRWFRTSINFLLLKKKENYVKRHRASIPLLLTSNYTEGHSLCATRSARSLVPKRFRGKRNSIPYPKFTNKCTCPRWCRRSASRFDRRFVPVVVVVVVDRSPRFSRSYPVIDVNGRPNFRVVTGLGHPPTQDGFTSECNVREDVAGANEKYPDSRACRAT